MSENLSPAQFAARYGETAPRVSLSAEEFAKLYGDPNEKATPAPGHTRPYTREDTAAMSRPFGAEDVLNGLAMAIPGSPAALAGVAKAGATVGKAASTALASPIVRGLATAGATEAFKKITGIDVPWWAETAIGAASGGTAVKASRPILKAALGTILKGEVAPAAEAAAAKVGPQLVTKAVDKGAEVAARHNALMKFAQDAVERGVKVGERIWVELDGAGNPVKILTPDQAGAATRAGTATTWVRNLWGS